MKNLFCCLLFVFIALSSMVCVHSQEKEATKQISEFVQQFSKIKESVLSNTSITVNEYNWTILSANKEVVSKVIDTFKKDSFADTHSSNVDALMENAAIKAESLTKILGKPRETKWTVEFLANLKKFTCKLGDDQVAEYKKNNVKYSEETQWIYTDSTKYTYNSYGSEVSVDPINPFAEGYPFPIYEMDISMMPLRTTPEAINKTKVRFKENECILESGGKTSKGISLTTTAKFSIDNSKICSQSISTISDTGSIYGMSLFSGYVPLPGCPSGSIPASRLSIKRINDTTLTVTFYGFKKIDFNSLTTKNFAINAPKGTAVKDSAVPKY